MCWRGAGDGVAHVVAVGAGEFRGQRRCVAMAVALCDASYVSPCVQECELQHYRNLARKGLTKLDSYSQALIQSAPTAIVKMGMAKEAQLAGAISADPWLNHGRILWLLTASGLVLKLEDRTGESDLPSLSSQMCHYLLFLRCRHCGI